VAAAAAACCCRNSVCLQLQLQLDENGSRTSSFLHCLMLNSYYLAVSLDERSNGKNIKALNSSGALNGNSISGGQSLHGHIDDTVHKDSDIACDGLRFRKGNVNKNLGNGVSHTTDSVSNTTANHYQDNSGSDPEQNDHSFSIDSLNPKKLRSTETNDTSQIPESGGFSVSPNDVG
jgi:sorting nexin-13